jgi:nitrite reductase/ring-hydroxylating ferredoxin subunit
MGCLGLMAGGLLLEGCASSASISAPIKGTFLEVDKLHFMDGDLFKKHLIVRNNQLQYPISLFRINESQYQALYMKCTHQGTELQVFGDRLQCPAHGSEFTNNGAVQNGPADSSLRSFPVIVENQLIKIDLS